MAEASKLEASCVCPSSGGLCLYRARSAIHFSARRRASDAIETPCWRSWFRGLPGHIWGAWQRVMWFYLRIRSTPYIHFAGNAMHTLGLCLVCKALVTILHLRPVPRSFRKQGNARLSGPQPTTGSKHKPSHLAPAPQAPFSSVSTRSVPPELHFEARRVRTRWGPPLGRAVASDSQPGRWLIIGGGRQS
jgi:hypothetical protein